VAEDREQGQIVEMSRVEPTVLLTIDEARCEFVASAYRLLREWTGGIEELPRALVDECPWQTRPAHEAFLLLDHQRVIAAIRSSGHEWVIDEQIDGIASAVDLGGNHLGDLGALSSVLDAAVSE
jgi:hypothetical protein